MSTHELLESVKELEKFLAKLDQQRAQESGVRDAAMEAVRKIDTKVKELKNKADSKKAELEAKIHNLEESVAEKVYTSLDDENAESEMRKLSSELDLMKRQYQALTAENRHTIISNCKREINQVNEACRDAVLHFAILNKMYIKYEEKIGSVITAFKKVQKEVEPHYQAMRNERSRVNRISGGPDFIKPVVEYLFNTNVKEPGTYEEGKTAHEFAEEFLNGLHTPELLEEAEKIANRIS